MVIILGLAFSAASAIGLWVSAEPARAQGTSAAAGSSSSDRKSTAPPGAAQQTPAPDVQKATVENLKAQREYYQSQTKWGKYASLGAAIAALVALVTLVANQRATYFIQEDARFDEAVKRFGDKDSPTTRASAAALLGQLGRRRRRLPWRVRIKRVHYSAAVTQLLAGIQLEENPVVLDAISTALCVLLQVNQPALKRKQWLDELYEQNLVLQHALAKVIADFFIHQHPPLSSTSAPEAAWTEVAGETSYDVVILKALADGLNSDRVPPYKECYDQIWRGAVLRATPAREQSNLRDLQELTNAALRLRSNIRVWQKALQLAPKGSNFDNLFLAAVKIVGGNSLSLRYANLQKTRLSGDLHGTKLEGARLDGAEIKADEAQATLRMEGADLTNAVLQSAFLSRVNLRRSVLDFTDFRNATLNGCDLSNANLSFADWTDITLTRCTLSEAGLRGLRFNEKTVKQLAGTDWSMANYGDEDDLHFDLLEQLWPDPENTEEERLKKLFNDDTMTKLNWQSKVHPSVCRYWRSKNPPEPPEPPKAATSVA